MKASACLGNDHADISACGLFAPVLRHLLLGQQDSAVTEGEAAAAAQQQQREGTAMVLYRPLFPRHYMPTTTAIMAMVVTRGVVLVVGRQQEEGVVEGRRDLCLPEQWNYWEVRVAKASPIISASS